jgi:tetratricopeptide (TPR) repeat protein
MSDGNDRTPAVPLKRPGRLRPSWLRRLVPLAAVVGLCVAIIEGRSHLALVQPGPGCADIAHDKRPDAVQVCQLEFQRTQDPATGLLLAKALRSDGDLAAAKRVAIRLLVTPVQSDALQILGVIARTEGNDEVARIALEGARKLHRSERNPRELARDDGVLASVRTDRSEFVEALQLIDECIAGALLSGDVAQQCYCHLTAARTLIRVGYFSAAEQERDLAELFLASEDARIDLVYQRASAAQESGDHELAIVRFEDALRRRKHPPDGWTISTELNLAYSLAEQQKLDDAQHYLEHARLLDQDNTKEPVRTWVAAQIAYRQHDLTRASSLTEKYFKLLDPEDPVGRDDQIDVAILQARIELERDDLKSAEYHARRGVKLVEDIRDAQSVLELRPWVLAKRRTAYELLFTALARSHQFEDAAMVFDAWQGRTVQDALARPRPPASLDYRALADQISRLGDWLPVASKAPFARRPDQESVLRTMHDIDLLALIVANGDVWILAVNHGPPQLSKIAPLTELQDLVDEFRGHPTTEVKRASALGALLLPDVFFRKTPEVLHVVVDGRLGGLPVAALRHGATPLIAMRPIVRVLRLPKTRCVHVTRSGAATVLAPPDAKLPNAAREAEQVAALLHTTSKIGAAATKAALFAAADDRVLHVAAHSTIGMDGASLVLADGDVSALEILARPRAPSLAVLSACNTATSNDLDLELAGSLAAGFLGAGSQHVVATLQSVSDAGALEISTRFYSANGVADPARALATVQAELVQTPNIDWPYFAVFGPDVCLGDGPDHP